MSILKKAEIIVACVQNATVIQTALYLQLFYYFVPLINLNNIVALLSASDCPC